MKGQTEVKLFEDQLEPEAKAPHNPPNIHTGWASTSLSTGDLFSRELKTGPRIRGLSAYLRVWVPYKKHGGTKKGQAMWSEMKAECREIHSSHSQVQQPDPDSLRRRIEKYI